MRDISERAQLEREDRAFTVGEVRDNEDGTLTFEGIASTVDVAYAVRDQFGEYSPTSSPSRCNCPRTPIYG